MSRTLDDAWRDLCQYLNGLGEGYGGMGGFSFHRTENRRREVMNKNGSAIVNMAQAWGALRNETPEQRKNYEWSTQHFKADYKINDAAAAIDDVLSQMKAWVTERERPEPKQEELAL